jgi:pilus assembly protein CpaF
MVAVLPSHEAPGGDAPMTDALRSTLYERTELADLSPAERRLALRRLALEAGGPEALPSVGALADEIDGFGILTGLMADDAVTDVLVNGSGSVWVERAGTLTPSDIRFESAEALTRFALRMVGRAGARLDRAHPLADARLPDGSRIHVVLPPVAPDGPLVSIRRFPAKRLHLEGLIAREMLTESQADALRTFVEERRTIVISGRTGVGKSTLLDALLRCIPSTERIVTIEELPELAIDTHNRVALIARSPNVEGSGAIGLDDLVKASLRMRPDRIVVGEVRGAEALSAIEAIATGHEGSMLTVHARSARDVHDRLTTLAMKAPNAPSESSLRRQLVDAIDLVVHLDRVNGRRCVTDLCARD